MARERHNRPRLLAAAVRMSTSGVTCVDISATQTQRAGHRSLFTDLCVLPREGRASRFSLRTQTETHTFSHLAQLCVPLPRPAPAPHSVMHAPSVRTARSGSPQRVCTQPATASRHKGRNAHAPCTPSPIVSRRHCPAAVAAHAVRGAARPPAPLSIPRPERSGAQARLHVPSLRFRLAQLPLTTSPFAIPCPMAARPLAAIPPSSQCLP